MKSGISARGLTVGLAIFGVLGVAYAQDAPAPTAPADAPAPPAEPTLTPQQMLSQARGFLPAMDRSAVVVRKQLTLAREQKDVVKALCLNDKLNQIDLATRTATDRVAGLEAAANANDAERSKHQYTVILVLRDRVNVLGTEANQCIGEDVGFVGESNVTMEIDPDIPDIDPSGFPDDHIVIDPPVVSPPNQPTTIMPTMDPEP
jgi:hypothetical protein